MSIPTRKPGRGKRKRRRKPIKKREHKYLYPHKPAEQRREQDSGLRNVLHMRVDRGWTQEELARRSGVKLVTIRAIEQGVTLDPKLSTLKKLAATYGVTVGVLVGVESLIPEDGDVSELPEESDTSK